MTHLPPVPVRIEVVDTHPRPFRPYRWRVIIGSVLTWRHDQGWCRTAEKAQAKAEASAREYLRQQQAASRPALLDYEVTP